MLNRIPFSESKEIVWKAVFRCVSASCCISVQQLVTQIFKWLPGVLRDREFAQSGGRFERLLQAVPSVRILLLLKGFLCSIFIPLELLCVDSIPWDCHLSPVGGSLRGLLAYASSEKVFLLMVRT